MKLFNLRPKVHFFHHFLTDLEALISQAPQHGPIFNSAGVFNCEANEDWIGRVDRGFLVKYPLASQSVGRLGGIW